MNCMKRSLILHLRERYIYLQQQLFKYKPKDGKVVNRETIYIIRHLKHGYITTKMHKLHLTLFVYYYCTLYLVLLYQLFSRRTIINNVKIYIYSSNPRTTTIVINIEKVTLTESTSFFKKKVFANRSLGNFYRSCKTAK